VNIVKTKQTRQELILEIIAKNTIETQEQLIQKLEEEDYTVTQATISRDIRELRLTKISCGFGVYKYVVNTQETHTHSAKYLNILKETVTSVDHAGNIVVVKTYAGMAQAAAAALDSMGWTELIGSIAGDDTIMLVVRSVESSRAFSSELSGLLGV
jgi:transcriptional regulator of arginine metabolism